MMQAASRSFQVKVTDHLGLNARYLTINAHDVDEVIAKVRPMLKEGREYLVSIRDAEGSSLRVTGKFTWFALTHLDKIAIVYFVAVLILAGLSCLNPDYPTGPLKSLFGLLYIVLILIGAWAFAKADHKRNRK